MSAYEVDFQQKEEKKEKYAGDSTCLQIYTVQRVMTRRKHTVGFVNRRCQKVLSKKEF